MSFFSGMYYPTSDIQLSPAYVSLTISSSNFPRRNNIFVLLFNTIALISGFLFKKVFNSIFYYYYTMLLFWRGCKFMAILRAPQVGVVVSVYRNGPLFWSYQ